MTGSYLNRERGGMSERPYVGETYRQLERLWFEAREMNLGYNIVDMISELFTFANMDAEMEEERNKMYDEREALEEKIEKLEAQVIALETERDNLEEQLEQARSAA